MENRIPDVAEVNIPFSKRKSIDSQIDAYKKQQAIIKDKKEKKDRQSRRQDKDLAKNLFDSFGAFMVDDVFDKRKNKEITKKQIREHLDQLVKWQPKSFIKLYNQFCDSRANKE